MNTTEYIKTLAKNLGFIDCTISQAGFLEEDAPKLEEWLNKNHHGAMGYMANYFDKRLDPRLLVEGAQSVISLSYNYFPEEQQTDNTYKISKYAYGEDYHHVVKNIMQQMVDQMHEKLGAFTVRIFIDSAPVLERAWAVKSGLGWRGKNANVITKKVGSFYFLAEIICDLNLEYDQPTTDHCGSCTRCIDACPTQAIISDGVVDGSKCISYFTIELKDDIPTGHHFDDWIFGCDICQDVCPWNRHANAHSQDLFKPKENLLTMSKKNWEELTIETYQAVFKKSAVKRTKYSGLLRNIAYMNKKE